MGGKVWGGGTNENWSEWRPRREGERGREAVGDGMGYRGQVSGEEEEKGRY